jgi:hypothetical protein
MAHTTKARWYWLVPAAQFDHVSAHQALDLLRYDGAIVESNAPPGYYMFSCDPTYHPRGPQTDRLRSHGVTVAVVVGPNSRLFGASQLWEWFHAQPKPCTA